MKHFVTFFALFLLLTACSSLKYSVEGKSPSPYVGKWLWEPDGEKGVSCLYIGERGDSLFIAVYAKLPYGWLFIPGYYDNPANEIYSPYICMPRPKKGNKAVAIYSHSPTNEQSVPRYQGVSLKLKDENTMEWKVELSEEINIPTKMVFKRESYKNYEFGEKVSFVYVNK